MKAFLQRDDNGFFYQGGGRWVERAEEALAFSNFHDAERFQQSAALPGSHVVQRIDPLLLARFSARAPGAYQVGE